MADRINFILTNKDRSKFIINVSNIYYALSIEGFKKDIIVDGFDPVTMVKYHSERINPEPDLVLMRDEYPELYYWNYLSAHSIFDNRILRYGEAFTSELPIDDFTQTFEFLNPQSSSQKEDIKIDISDELVNIDNIDDASYGIYAYSEDNSGEDSGMLTKSAIIDPKMHIRFSPYNSKDMSTMKPIIAGLTNTMRSIIGVDIKSKIDENTKVFLTRDFREAYTKYRSVINSAYYRRKGGITNFYIFRLYPEWNVALYK